MFHQSMMVQAIRQVLVHTFYDTHQQIYVFVSEHMIECLSEEQTDLM